MDGSVAEHYPIPYVHATDNEVTFLIDFPGSSVSAKRGAVSVFKNSSRLAVKPSPWLLMHEGSLMLNETSGANADAVMRRPGIKSSFFGTVKRSFAPRHIPPTSPWVSRSCVRASTPRPLVCSAPCCSSYVPGVRSFLNICSSP